VQVYSFAIISACWGLLLLLLLLLLLYIVEDDYDDDDNGSSDSGDEDKDVTVLTTVWTVIKNKGNLSVQCHLLIIYWNLFLRTPTFFVTFSMKQQLWETESLDDKIFKCCSRVWTWVFHANNICNWEGHDVCHYAVHILLTDWYILLSERKNATSWRLHTQCKLFIK